VSGLLGATSIRAVFALDVIGLAALALLVHRMGNAGGDDRPRSTTPEVNEEPMLSETV